METAESARIPSIVAATILRTAKPDPKREAETGTEAEEPMLGLTEKAAEKVREIQAAETIEATYGLRLRVVGGGCSGFAYDLYFDQLTEMDLLRELAQLREDPARV